MVERTHDKLGHVSKKGVFECLRQGHYSPGMRGQIDEILKFCVTCLKYNIQKTVKCKDSTVMAAQSGQKLQVDVMGPICSSNGYRYILGLVDCYDRNLFLVPLKTLEAKEMQRVLIDFFSENGLWEFIQIDFKCITLKGLDSDLIRELRVGIIRSNHHTNSQSGIERQFQTSLITLLKMMDGQPDLSGWPRMLGRLSFVMNNRPLVSLGWRSSSELRFLHPPRLLGPLHQTHMAEKGDVKGLQFMSRMHDEVREAAFRAIIRNKNFAYPNDSLSSGMVLFRKRQNFSRHSNKKLQYKVIDAYEVLKRVGSGTYLLLNLRTNKNEVLPVCQLIRTKLNKAEVMGILDKLDD